MLCWSLIDPWDFFGVDQLLLKGFQKNFKLCVLNVDYTKKTNVSIYISIFDAYSTWPYFHTGHLNCQNIKISPVAFSITVMLPMTLVRKKIYKR